MMAFPCSWDSFQGSAPQMSSTQRYPAAEGAGVVGYMGLLATSPLTLMRTFAGVEKVISAVSMWPAVLPILSFDLQVFEIARCQTLP